MFSYLAVKCKSTNKLPKSAAKPLTNYFFFTAISIEEVNSQSAFAGDSVSLTIASYDQQNMAVGYVLCDPTQPVPITTKFEARIVLFNITVPVTKGFSVSLDHTLYKLRPKR